MIHWKSLATAFVVVACLSMTMARPAHAEDALSAAKAHYKTGLAAYQSGDYAAAVDELKEAYRLHPLPAMLINLGRTYRKMGKSSEALEAFQHYLKEAPPTAKERPEAEAAVRELTPAAPPPAAADVPSSDDEVPGQKHAKKPAAEPAPPAPEPEAAPAPAFEFEHSAIDAAPPETPLDVTVKMPVLKGVKVFVYYRASGDGKFTAVLMKRHGNRKVGRIPADVVQGKAVQYYIEARDDHDAVMRTIGSDTSPNIVIIDPTAKPQIFDENQADTGPAVAAGDHSDDEAAPGLIARKGSAAPTSSAPSHFGGLFYAGVVTTIVGAGLFVGGMVGLSKAAADANTISSDAKNGDPTRGGSPYQFQDPTAPGGIDDASIQADGKHWNNIGIGLGVTGAIFAAGGLVMIIAERVGHRHQEETPPTKRRHSDEAKASSWMIAPSAGPKGAGVGFSATF